MKSLLYSPVGVIAVVILGALLGLIVAEVWLAERKRRRDEEIRRARDEAWDAGFEVGHETSTKTRRIKRRGEVFQR